MMTRKWEARTNLSDGYARITFDDGTSLVVKDDGVTGYDFVEQYLALKAVNYPSHLLAAELKLNDMMGRAAVRTLKACHYPRYRALVALISLNCCYGREDEIPDCDGRGHMHPEFVCCKERFCCPYNGYNERLKEKKLVICNPVYECGLTPRQARVANLLVNTAMTHEQMATILNETLAGVKQMTQRIYASQRVADRGELTEKLRGKRLV